MHSVEQNVEESSFELSKVILDKLDELNNTKNSNDEEEEDIDIDDDDKKKDNSQPAIIISSLDSEPKIINSQKFDGKISEFKEEDGIKLAILRMKEANKNERLELPYEKPYIPNNLKPDLNESIKENELPIYPLIEQSWYISQYLIQAASKEEIPFSNMAANILIDCSTFISDENKIFNMIISCALANAFSALEIPYSAAVIGDSDFKCILKTFNEPHSPIVLQRICDCLLIRPFRTKLAKSTKFAIEHAIHT